MRRVLVTGGGSGIGRAIARAFAAEGDAVTICGRRLDALEETAEGHAMTALQADMTDEASVDALFEQPFDVVVANAGIARTAKLVDLSLSDWNETLAVSLTGVFLTFRGALRSMGQGGNMSQGGRLIAIASTASLQGGATLSAYAAAKHGVLGLVRSTAKEVAKAGITCNAICPGFVDTDLAAGAAQGVAKKFGVDEPKAMDMVVAANPMRRLIAPEEVAATALFLASAGAASINGHALSVSGGEI
ncbi:MAG: SDR family oxidoreductase [Devosiaceae bacterium]|nr:SDR family oxidoreductase [Devosiaceae bacterium MH13]